MGRIPRIALATAAAVVLPHDRPAIAKARPPSARGIAFREQGAIGVAAGEDVMPGRCHVRACLGERRIPGEIDTLAVELLDTARDLDPLRVDPRTPADPIARVDRRPIRRRWCAEVRTPLSIAASDRRGTLETERIRSGEPAQVAAKTSARARHEERHLRRNRWGFLCRGWCGGQ